MTLSALITAVGDEHIKVQRIDTAVTNVSTNKKGDTKLTFVTREVQAGDFFEGVTPKMHGLIIWIPRDKIPTLTP